MRLSLLIFHRKLVGTGVFRIVVGNPVFPFCFLVFWGLVKHIYIRSSSLPGAVGSGGDGEETLGGQKKKLDLGMGDDKMSLGSSLRLLNIPVYRNKMFGSCFLVGSLEP